LVIDDDEEGEFYFGDGNNMDVEQQEPTFEITAEGFEDINNTNNVTDEDNFEDAPTDGQ